MSLQLCGERTSSYWKACKHTPGAVIKKPTIGSTISTEKLVLKIGRHHWKATVSSCDSVPTHLSPGGMQLNAVQGSALLSGGLPHNPELLVGTVIIISLMDTLKHLL